MISVRKMSLCGYSLAFHVTTAKFTHNPPFFTQRWACQGGTYCVWRLRDGSVVLAWLAF